MTETRSTGVTPTRSEVERAVSFGVRAPSIHPASHAVLRPTLLRRDRRLTDGPRP